MISFDHEFESLEVVKRFNNFLEEKGYGLVKKYTLNDEEFKQPSYENGSRSINKRIMMYEGEGVIVLEYKEVQNRTFQDYGLTRRQSLTNSRKLGVNYLKLDDSVINEYEKKLDMIKMMVDQECLFEDVKKKQTIDSLVG